ncbi:MAG: TonB-dependent receptor [Calditrichaeota bacterium]|nr:TonB-dependent receptor [Calditrichota bacterium]
MTNFNRHVKSFCFIVAALLVIFIAHTNVWAGTTGKIAGIVMDSSTKEGLPGANIVIVGTQLGASADVNGKFFILNVPPGDYSVRATMMGYGSVLQQKVRVNADRTTDLNFGLSQAVLEGKEVVVTASRPLVEKDVAASQSITTSKIADALPVSDIMAAVSLEPGIGVATNKMAVSIRGGGNDQISFQVDGMERKDKLNDKVYVPTNSALVSEIQVLSGGFNAEYGNIRSGVFNIVSKEGGNKFFGSMDYRNGPAHQKHFGPNAYGTDQYDWKTYASPAAFNEILDAEGNSIFMGWNALADLKNGENYMGKSDWTGQQLLDVWKFRHRPIDYTNNSDHYVDFGFGGPLGIKNAGFLLGLKYNRIFPILPSVRGNNQIISLEGKVHFKPTSAIKVTVNGLYGKTETTTPGRSWGAIGNMEYGADIVGSALGRDKYYLSAQDLLNVWTKQLGIRMTHTLSPSTFYEIRYNNFRMNSEAGRPPERKYNNIVKSIGGVGLNEEPAGWAVFGLGSTDLTGKYDFFGGAQIEDTSSVVTNLLNFDLTSQINNQHLIKLGFEYETDHVVKDMFARGNETVIGDPNGDNLHYNRTPYHIGSYIQDKIEYGGMIANIGLRVEHYDARGYIWDNGYIYSPIYGAGGTVGYASTDDLPKEKSKAYTVLAPRLAFSHPVRENTKFFFNYGVYYSEPTNAHRYGIKFSQREFGNIISRTRTVGYANLEPARTSAYEIGFEQSVADQWLIRAYFYAKDNTEQISQVYVMSMRNSDMVGYFANQEGLGKGQASYYTYRNHNYGDIRGIELKITKRYGQFFSGWATMDYRISTSGNYGLSQYFQDPLRAYTLYSAVKLQPQSEPRFLSNLNLHTPTEWGKLKGEWQLSINQSWSKGPRLIYNPSGLPTREVKTIYHWVNMYKTSFRVSKHVNLMSALKLLFYMDVNNLFNYRHLNLGILSGSQQDLYLTQVVDSNNGLNKKIGEYKDNNGKNVFTETWTDKNGNARAPIAPEKDFALFYYPRSFLLGVKIEY